MQINTTADQLLASLETKRLRRPWNPDLHPRDSKGRFIETGGIARLWGGGLVRVVRALGGRDVLVENESNHQRSQVNAARLTMVARPDGSAPTRSKKKVRDEDARRTGDENRGRGDANDDDKGDKGKTPDEPHPRDDEGKPIGDDVEGQDHGSGPEPHDDDDLLVPQGRVMPNARDERGDPLPASERQNGQTRHFPNLLRITDGDDGRSRHVAGNGDALRARGPQATGSHDGNPHRFHDTSHARRAMTDLADDYLGDLEGVWPADWRNSEASDLYDQLDNELGHYDPVTITDAPDKDTKRQFDQEEVDRLQELADDAERLSELADRDGRDDVARYAQNLSDALNLAHERFQAHGDEPIPKPRKSKKPPLVPRGWRPEPIPQNDQSKGKGRRKADQSDTRRFKTLADVQQHWASGQLTPHTNDKERQAKHEQAVRQLYSKLQNPQLSTGGTFVVAKITMPKGDGTPETRYAIEHVGTGGQLTTFGRKAEAMDFANRLEKAQVDGKPFDWDSPGLNDRLQEEGAKKEFGRILAETQKAFDDKARKKSGGMRQQPAPEQDAARKIADRTGAPAANVGVGHVGPKDSEREGARTQPKPQNEQRDGDEQPTPGRPAIPAGATTNDDDAENGQRRDKQEEQQGESVRRAGAGVLGDVPADGTGGDSGERAGGVLHQDRRGGGDGDRRDVSGPGAGSGAGRGTGRSGAVRPDSDGEASGSRDGDARAGVRGEGAGDRGQGHADDQVSADDHRVAFGSSAQEETAPSFTPPADGHSLVPSTVQARVRANIAAIEVLRRLEAENRPATAAEQDTLARWSGWGATPQVFVDSPKEEFAPLQAKLKELLSEAEYAAAKENTLNAHYTDPAIVQGVWQALRDLGFDGGDVLEPGSGSGNFIGYAPDGARMTGVELDPITAGIAKALYPHADIRNEGFEKTRVPDGTFDMTVGNVPFGDYKVVDLRHNKGGHNIHNHFILKSLDLTRPGGLVAVVTSRYTMDGATARAEDARMEMARKADLVGAIRLPSGAHRRTAGTDVVTDLLIFRRRDKDREFSTGRDRTGAVKLARGKDDPPVWVHTTRATNLPGQTPPGQDGSQPLGESVFVNPYFLHNRERVLGELAVGSGMYSDGELRVDADGHLEPALDKALRKVVADAKAEGLGYKKDSGDRPKARLLPAGSGRIDGHVQAEDDGTFTQVRDGQIHDYHVPATQAEEVRQLLGLRDAMKTLIAEESRPDADEQVIAMLRADLNARYDKYKDKFGALNRFTWGTRKAVNPATGETVEKATKKRPQMGGLISKDPTMAVVLSLDTYDAVTGKSSKASVFSKRQAVHRTIADRANSPEDAMALVLEEHGRIDDEALGKVLALTPEDARARLLDARSTDPDSGREWPLVFEPLDGGDLIPAADYLSGNVREKLYAAQEKAGEDRRFEVNVRHLEEVLPPDIAPGEIDAPMGASWLGAEPVQQFLREILRTRDVRVYYHGGSLWKVEAPDSVKKGTAAQELWGSRQWNAIKLAEAILTNGRIQVRVKPDDGPSYIDEEATAVAQAKAEEMRERFQDWLWEDPKRAEVIKRAYNDTHNNLALRSYDGQRRTLPGLAQWFKPHAHQHSAVARMVNEPAVLLAHEVGAGKTAEMTMGVMELRRLGLINKAAMVVPGHMLQQFHDEFVELYPQSAGRILTASSEDLAGRKRREFIARAATGDWDAVIMTQTAFESIQMRPEAQLAYINREKESLERALARQKQDEEDEGKRGRSDSRMVKEIQKRLKNLEAKIEEKISGQKDAAGLSFEDTGIDYVVVDEAHHYKNLSTASSIPGAAIEGSNRASDLDMKLEYLRSRTKSGRVVTFATATPISNSVTEAHTMLRYLRPDLLEKAQIRDFDQFASTYGKIVSGVELAADGTGFKEVSRFAAFRNMPELLRIWRTVADVKTAEDLNLDVPDIAGGKAITITVEPTDGQMQYQAEIAARAARVKAGDVEPTEDNMLKINSDGRKVSLDPRMVGIDEIGNKLPAAADNIARIHEQTKDAVYPTSKNDDTPHPTPGGLQIVFLDMGTPKDPGRKKKTKNAGPTDAEEMAQSDFAAYDEMKALLVERGIPADKIRFIHEAKNDADKARLFDDARIGKIAVLLGSTTKMGTGTNVQLRATALHHLDVPWRPADLEQRNGRIIRQGNANPEVAIFQYVTEQSFDGFSWQTVARKAKFIRQLMKGTLTERTVEDIPDGVFNPEQVTAMATGNAYLLEQANVRASLAILQRKFKGYLRAQSGFQSTIQGAERLREQTDKLVAKLLDVAERKKDTRGDNFEATIGTKTFTKRQDAMDALATAAKAVIREGERNPRGTHESHLIGKLGNIDVAAQYKRDWSRPYGEQGTVVISLPDVPYSSRTYGEVDLDTNGITPVTRLEDSLANVEADIARAESKLRVEERNAEDAKQRVDKPFEQAGELEAAERRNKLVAAAIREQSRAVSSEQDGAAKRARLEQIEHNLREARIAAGEDPADADDPAQAQDTDLIPRTPAPPSINQDAQGNTRVLWPDAEARKKRRAREKAQRDGTPIPDDTAPAGDEPPLTPQQVSNDINSLRQERPAVDRDRRDNTTTPSPDTPVASRSTTDDGTTGAEDKPVTPQPSSGERADAPNTDAELPDAPQPKEPDSEPTSPADVPDRDTAATPPNSEPTDTPMPAAAAATAEEDTGPLSTGDQVLTSTEGPGEVRAANGDSILVRTDISTRVWPLNELRTLDGKPIMDRRQDSREQRNQRVLAEARTPEGHLLQSGNRLRNLDTEAGHGEVVDENGNIIGWVRARIGDNGKRYWWAQDADGGSPDDMPFHEDLPVTAGVPAARAAGNLRDGIDRAKYSGHDDESGKPEREKRRLITPDRAIKEITLTSAQVRELSKLQLAGTYADGTPIDTLPWDPKHRRYSPWAAQAGALAAAARAAAAKLSGDTIEERRNKGVLLGAARKLEFTQYDAARQAASIPPIGQPDPYDKPYVPRPEAPEDSNDTGTPGADAAQNARPGPDTRDQAETPQTPPPATPTPAAQREEQPESARPFRNSAEWRRALVPVDAAENHIRDAADRTWGREDMPDAVERLRTAILGAVAAQEVDDFDDAERLLTKARGHAAGLLATLDDRERQTMEGSLRGFLGLTDDYLARHRATRQQRERQDAQARRIEEEAADELRRTLRQTSTTATPEAPVPPARQDAADNSSTHTTPEAGESATSDTDSGERPQDGDTPAQATGSSVHGEPPLSFPHDRGGHGPLVRQWAGVWAQPQPDGVNNVFLDRAVAQHRAGWVSSADPYEVQQWIRTVVGVEPLAQYDENTRRSLDEMPPQARQFLADLAENLRSSMQKLSDELRADLRPVLMDHIATRSGRQKAKELRAQMAEERAQKAREAVREHMVRARAGAAEHGLTEQQAADFLTSVVGGDDTAQVSYGIRGEYPEALRSLHAALADASAYSSAFSGWATNDDTSRWAGTHWENARRKRIGAPLLPSADPVTGSGYIKVGEAELPKGMRWARGADLRQGDIFHGLRGTDDVFDGMDVPQYVIHTHRDGVDGRVRAVPLDANVGSHDPAPDDHVIIVENPEPKVRQRARERARTDDFTNWELPRDDETYELGGPDRVAELVARAEVTRTDGSSERESIVTVDGVEIGRVFSDRLEGVGDHHSVDSEGGRRTWHSEDLAVAGLVAAHDSTAARGESADGQSAQGRQSDADQADREGAGKQDGRGGEQPTSSTEPPPNGDNKPGGVGRGGRGGNDSGGNEPPGGSHSPGEADGDENRASRQGETDDDQEQRDERSHRQNSNRSRPDGTPDGGRPGGAGGPGLPRLPGGGRNSGDGSGGGDSSRATREERTKALRERYRSGSVPTPPGTDPAAHQRHLNGLAGNDTLTLSPNGSLITWSDDGGRTWEFGQAVNGRRMARFAAEGEEIGGQEGARRLAGAYEQLRDDRGQLIDWTNPELDKAQLSGWRDGDGRTLGSAVSEARQNASDAHRRDRRQAAGQSRAGRQERTGSTGDASGSSDQAASSTGEGEGNNGALPGDSEEANSGSPENAGAADASTGSGAAQNDGQDNQAGGTTAASSQYTINADHSEDGSERRAGTVDGRRIPTIDELEQYETEDGKNLSEEGERALFGPPEEMRKLAAEGFIPTPVVRKDHGGQVWRNGRLIGSVTPGYHDPDSWHSEGIFSNLRDPNFSSQEAAIAYLVLRDKERGEPDLSVVHPDLAWHMSHTAQSLGFPDPKEGLRGLESLRDNPADMERYNALRERIAEMGRGVTPSGNVADDLDHIHDELRWLDATHYKHQKADLKRKHIQGPGWLADDIREILDVLRPEDPRALHHEASKNRAAHQFLAELQANGAEQRAERVPSGEIREGDVVHLDGRITGLYAGATDAMTGYVIGAPKPATLTTFGRKEKAWRITVSKDPWPGTRTGLETRTFIIPRTDSGLRLVRAEDVHLPFEDQHYGRRAGHGEATGGAPTRSSDTHSATGDSPQGTSGPEISDAGSDGDAASSRSGSGTAPGDTSAEQNGDRGSTSPNSDSEAAIRNNAGSAAGSSRRKRDTQPFRQTDSSREPSDPEPVGGRRAEWVQASDLAVGDLVRIDGITKRGTPRTLTGFVVDGPRQIPTERAHRVQDMQRLLIADTPDGRSGDRQSVWVPMDATAARATDDVADGPKQTSLTGADLDVRTGRIAGRVPTDASGRGLFPGSIVHDSRGREGTVTGANDTTASVRWGDDRDDEDMAPSALTIADSGAARPSGWTDDGHRVQPGQVVTDRSGSLLGTVEEVDGDTATIATPDGMQPTPVADIRVAGGVSGTANHAPRRAKVGRIEPTTAGDLKQGDVIVHDDGRVPFTGKVTSLRRDGDRVQLDITDTTTGEIRHLDTTAEAPVNRLHGPDGGAPNLGPDDAPDSADALRDLDSPPAAAPVAGTTVDPQLAPEERDAIASLGQAPLDDPAAQQGADRIARDLPVTPEQAGALADSLRAHSTSDTAEGRAAQRAADHLDAAAGRTPGRGEQARPEPGTIGAVGVGDHIFVPSQDDPDTLKSYRVAAIDEVAGGLRELTLEDADGLRTQQTFADSDPLWQAPEPNAPETDGEQRDANPAPDAENLSSGYTDAVVRAVIDAALAGISEDASIHQLRQDIAERLTPESLRDAMRKARTDAIAAIDAAGISGEERAALLRTLRPKAARARREAVKAALRTLDDLEPLEGESEQDTARRAADLLRLIPASLPTPDNGDSERDSAPDVDAAVSGHVDGAVADALGHAGNGALTEERRAAIVNRLASQMAANRDETAQRIAAQLPAGQRAGVLPHILAALVFIARKVVQIVAAFLRGLAKVWRNSREGLRRLRERIARFRRRLVDGVRAWPENRRLRRLAGRALPQPETGTALADRIAHWTRLMPAPGRFGQVSRRSRWYLPARRNTLAAGQLPPVQDGVRWLPDRAADRGPGPEALRHLAALRAAGADMDTALSARLAAGSPELGDEPHRAVRDAMDYAAIAERRLRDLTAAADGGTDADAEIEAARVEAQAARQDAIRLRGLYAAALPDTVRDLLAQVREMGPGGSSALVLSDESDPEAARVLAGMQQYVPRDWLAPAGNRLVTARRGEEGGYDGPSRTATLADLGDGGRGTAAHALITHLQRNYPDIIAAQDAYHFARTHQGRTGARRSSLDVLLARLFGDQGSQGRAEALTPRGLMTLFEGDWYISDDLRAFLLGLLATR
ncbi:SNF2-related protein [Streptomyces hundungensis]|uniref:DEAD/DEAH box helicase family protein n=1 Tax=Streptomyces hundungensis TaxID=1077946 RepID=UPI0033FA40E8